MSCYYLSAESGRKWIVSMGETWKVTYRAEETLGSLTFNQRLETESFRAGGGLGLSRTQDCRALGLGEFSGNSHEILGQVVFGLSSVSDISQPCDDTRPLIPPAFSLY